MAERLLRMLRTCLWLATFSARITSQEATGMAMAALATATVVVVAMAVAVVATVAAVTDRSLAPGANPQDFVFFAGFGLAELFSATAW